MSSQRFESRPAGVQPALTTVPCPCVADLIDFAQGRVNPEDRQRIEVHLQSTGCPHCRGWIAKSVPPFDSPQRNSSPPLAAADSAKWQRLVFQDLGKRLRQLEET